MEHFIDSASLLGTEIKFQGEFYGKMIYDILNSSPGMLLLLN